MKCLENKIKLKFFNLIKFLHELFRLEKQVIINCLLNMPSEIEIQEILQCYQLLKSSNEIG